MKNKNYLLFEQVGTIKLYLEPMMIAALYGLIGTIQSIVVGVVVERNLSAWKLELNMELVLIFLSVSAYRV